MKPYQMDSAQVAAEFGTNIHTGLTQQQVEESRNKYGKNMLPDVARPSIVAVFFEQFKSPLIYVLLVAAVIIFFVGEHKTDAFIISGVLFFNAIIGTIQQKRAANILEGLKRLIKSDSIVLRNKTKVLVEDSELVPGDIIILQQGQRVPADARIIESDNLQVDEAMLTGESQAVRKIIDPLTGAVSLGDRTNMLFKGTYIVGGDGKAIVVGTGVNTEIGAIHVISEDIKTDIPLKKEIERLSYIILICIFVLCAILFIVGALTGKPLGELLIMLAALFICVIPEGLPVVVTLVLVSGAYRMARKNVLVKNLQGVEALGRTDVIVIDKTGTLTRNEMMVSDVFVDSTCLKVSGQGYFTEGGVYDAQAMEKTLYNAQETSVINNNQPIKHIDAGSPLYQLGIAASLLNNAEITFLPKLETFDIKGDPTEAALYILSQKLGLSRDDLEKKYKKVYEMPFDSTLKYHAGFFKIDNKSGADRAHVVGSDKSGCNSKAESCSDTHNGSSADVRVAVFIIGSPEVILGSCVAVSETAQKQLACFLESGLRVVALAVKYITLDQLPDEDCDQVDKVDKLQKLVTQDVQFLGLCGLQDSIRSDVKAIIAQTHAAGLQLIMATGDHKKTALFVAKQVGLYTDGDQAIDGLEFDQLTDEQLIARLDYIKVYARVSPQQKMRIISLFHRRDALVAMTGDGINDAPSLVAADLGIAMGGIGTEVAKQAADLVLLDDSLASIIAAIEEGRHIFYVLRRVILYFFATNLGEVLIVLFALLANLPLPITAAQILWLNFATDGFLDAALSMEPHEAGLLVNGAVVRNTRLVDYDLLKKTLFMAMPMGLGSLFVFWQFYQQDLAHARTMTLITMAMFQWFNAWNCRSERLSLFQLGLFTNHWLVFAALFVLSLQFALLYTPFMREVFKTVPLSCSNWLLIIAVSGPIVLAEEVRKWVVRRWSW